VATPPTYAADWGARFLILAAAATAPQQAWIDARLSAAWGRHDATLWGADRAEATLLLVAHQWTLETQAGAAGTGAAGAVTSKSAGRWGQSNAAPTAPRGIDGGDLTATIWGQQYLQLLAARGPTIGVTG
jgi:hypothetical protein